MEALLSFAFTIVYVTLVHVFLCHSDGRKHLEEEAAVLIFIL